VGTVGRRSEVSGRGPWRSSCTAVPVRSIKDTLDDPVNLSAHAVVKCVSARALSGSFRLVVGAPDEPVDRDPPWDVAKTRHERDQQQQQGRRSRQVDGDQVHVR
jgi:hypothetical protein